MIPLIYYGSPRYVLSRLGFFVYIYGKFTLSQDEISSLKAAHRATKKKREADRIKVIIFLGTGWTIREVLETLMLYEETIRNYLKWYKTGAWIFVEKCVMKNEECEV